MILPFNIAREVEMCLCLYIKLINFCKWVSVNLKLVGPAVTQVSL